MDREVAGSRVDRWQRIWRRSWSRSSPGALRSGSVAAIGSTSAPDQVGGTLGEHVGGEARRRSRRHRAVRWRTAGRTGRRRRRRRRRAARARRRRHRRRRRRAHRPEPCSRPPGRRAGVRSAVTAARVARVVEGGASIATSSGSSSARHSTASAPWPGAGSICSGSRTSVTSSEPAEPGEAGAGEHDGVELAVGDLAEPGVDVAADRRRCSRPRPSAVQLGRSGAASRCRRGAGRQARRGSGRRGRPARRAGPRAAGTAASASPSGAAGRQVLQRVDGEVDLAGEQRLAQRVTKTPVPPIWRERAAVDVARR